MRLFIAEKPSLARSIAAVLSKPQQNHKLYIQAGDDIVAWAAGHLLEQAMPEAYDDKYKRWNVADLPIFPDVWKLLVKKESKDLFDNIKTLLKKADTVQPVSATASESGITVSVKIGVRFEIIESLFDGFGVSVAD